MNSIKRPLCTVYIIGAVALPWVNPFAYGPTPSVLSVLFSWTCVVCIFSCCQDARFLLGWSLSIAQAWLAAALLSCVMGLLQYFGAATVFDAWISASPSGQAFANLRQRNQLATLTNVGLVALLWWIAQDRPMNQRASLVYSLAAGALLAAGNAATSSRTGLLQLLVLYGGTWLWRGGVGPIARTLVQRVLLTVALIYSAAASWLPMLARTDSSGILTRLQEGNSGCESRLTLWSNVLHLIAQKPWLGWGWGELDYAHFITLYPETRFCEILDNAHNLPLHLAVELGVPLALCVCVTVVWLVWRARPWKESNATRQMAWAVLALIGVHSLLEYPLWYGPFQMAVVLCLFLLWRQPVRPPRGLVVSVAALILGFCSYAAWDYWRISQIYLPVESRARAYQTNTLEKIRGSWLFHDQVQFAELTTTTITPANASHTLELAKELLHFSPEPRVAQALIDSAKLLGREDEVQYYQARLKVAFPTAAQ